MMTPNLSLAEPRSEVEKPAVLVVDELGYLTYSNDAANVLYHVVNNRYLKRRSMIFTTNKPLDAWGAVLHDNDLATAILDRVFERGRKLELDGPSHRTMHLGIDDPTAPVASNDPAGLTGKHRQEFPEPTAAGARPFPRPCTRCRGLPDGSGSGSPR